MFFRLENILDLIHGFATKVLTRYRTRLEEEEIFENKFFKMFFKMF